MKLLLTSTLLMCIFSYSAQDVIWTEDFGSGCNQGQLANAYSGANGSWSISNTGTNEAVANTFYISAAENGNGVGNCGSGCGNNQTLHVSNVFVDAILIQIPPDQGAAYYDSGASGLCGFIDCAETNKRVESPVIDCTGYENITLDMAYLEGGNATSDNATIEYNLGSGWVTLDDPAKTLCCGGACNGTNQGIWTSYTISLPEGANDNPNVQIGFKWVNNDDAVGTDPSFAADDITISGTAIESDSCLGDFNNDGYINTADLLLFLADFGCIGDCVADLNNDGVVSTLDLLDFLGLFGTEC